MQTPFPPEQEDHLESQRLKTLAIFHYIAAGLWGLGLLLGVIIGLVLVGMLGGQTRGNNEGIRFATFDNLLSVIIVCIELLEVVLPPVLLFVAGRNLAKHRGLVFVQVVAILELLFFPLGTILGVFTLMALSRPAVKALFHHSVTP